MDMPEYIEPEQTGLEIVADFDYEAPECFVPREWLIDNKYEWGEPDTACFMEK